MARVGRKVREEFKQESVRGASYRASSGIFFLLMLLLSISFYVLGAAGNGLPIATFLPRSALMAFVPMIAALILFNPESSARGARQLFARALDYRRITGVAWVLAPLVLMPIDGPPAMWRAPRRGARCRLRSSFRSSRSLRSSSRSCPAPLARSSAGRGMPTPSARKGKVRSMPLSSSARSRRSGTSFPRSDVPQRRLDGVAVNRQNRASRHHRLAVCDHWSQRLGCRAVSHDDRLPLGLFQNYGSFSDPFVMFVIVALVTVIVVALWGAPALARFAHDPSRA